MTYVVGFNMPGYLPDDTPVEYDDWNTAHEALINEITAHYADFEHNVETLTDEQNKLIHDALVEVQTWQPGTTGDVTIEPGVSNFFLLPAGQTFTGDSPSPGR